MRFIWHVLKSYAVQWVTQWRCHPSTLLLTCVWLMREKIVFTSWEVFLFPLLGIDAAKSMMKLYQSSKFNVRTEDTEISFRIQNWFLPSVPATIKRIGWGDRERYTSAPAQAQLLAIRAQLCHLAQHRKQAGRDLLSLHIQRTPNQDPCHHSSGTEHGFYTLHTLQV